MIAQYSIPGWHGDNAVRYEASQVAIMNTYFNHPSDQSRRGSRCLQNSSLDDGAGYWRATAPARFTDRPFFGTEFNHAFWNPYQHEYGLVFGAYSALQGYDALIVHAEANVLTAHANSSWTVGSSPIARACEFVISCLFLREDVRPADHRVEMRIPSSLLTENATVSTKQSKLALLTGFSSSFPGLNRPAGMITPPTPDFIMAPSGKAAGSGTTGWSMELADTQEPNGFSLPNTVAELKNMKILPATNQTSVERQIFQSDTGEILMRSAERVLKVVTPRTEAVTLTANKSEPLGVLSIHRTDVPACVAACAMDSRPLADSERIVLIYATDVVNSGMEVSADRVTLLQLGKFPPLLRTGTMEMSLARTNPQPMSLYALGIDGVRKEPFPLSSVGNALHIKLETARLVHGPTVFFELSSH